MKTVLYLGILTLFISVLLVCNSEYFSDLVIPTANSKYIDFNDKDKRNHFNIGIQPQSPFKNVKDKDLNQNMEPTCGCSKQDNL
jgi:hypothetical protein